MKIDMKSLNNFLAGLCLLAVSLGDLHAAAPARTYTNPVFTSQDPWVIQWKGNYYYSDSNNTVISIRKSPTLTGLSTAVPVTVWTAPPSGPNAVNVWAPEVHNVNGQWYIYYAAADVGDDHHLFLLQSTTSSPMGPYVPANTGFPSGQIEGIGSTGGTWNEWGIDPDEFTATDGKNYLTWSAHSAANGTQSIFIAPLQDAGHFASDPVQIATPDQPWEQRGAWIEEGPVGYTRAGRTFVTYSASPSWDTAYCVGLLTNTDGNISNPSSWTKSIGPILDHHDTAYGPGSVVFVPSPDGTETWMMYHGIDTSDGGYQDRDIRIQRMTWNADGSPVLGYPVDPGVSFPVPSGDAGNAGWDPSQNDNAQAGTWSSFSASGVTLASTGPQNMLFRGRTNLFDFTVTAQAQPTGTSGDDGFPKYGVYPLYIDASDYVLACIDTNNGVFATDAVIAGINQGWQNNPLPNGFAASHSHTISVTKSDQNFLFKLDRATDQQRTFNLTEGQIGLYSDGMSAVYKGISVTDNSAGWADAFGDAAEGRPQNGARTSGWTVSPTGVMGTSSSGISHIFQGDPNLPSYTLSAQLQWVSTNSAGAFPKYGVFAAYNDAANFAEVYIDINNGVLATHAIVGGQDQGWQNTSLPAGFNPSLFHTLTINKADSLFTFSLDGVQAQQRTFAIENGQYGLVTDFTQANYSGVQVGP